MSKPQEEQIKLFAAYLNTIGAGMIVTGIVAPTAALIINPALPEDSIIYFALISFRTVAHPARDRASDLREIAVVTLQTFAFVVMPLLTVSMAGAGYGFIAWQTRSEPREAEPAPEDKEGRRLMKSPRSHPHPEI